MPVNSPNLTKIFTIAGVVFAEVYMLATVLPIVHHTARESPIVIFLSAFSTLSIPWSAALGHALAAATVPIRDLLLRLVIYSVFFIPFGGAAGMGLGLLVSGLLGKIFGKAALPP